MLACAMENSNADQDTWYKLEHTANRFRCMHTHMRTHDFTKFLYLVLPVHRKRTRRY